MGCSQSEPNEPTYPQSFYRKPRLLFALGGPGSDKASYCDRLVQDYRLKYLAIKDIVQFETNRNSPYSRQIKNCMSKGSLISSQTITRLIKKAIANYGPRSFLIDGFPRNVENIESFQQLLAGEVELVAVLYFDCSEAKMRNKIVKDGGGRLSEQKIQGLIELYQKEVMPVVRHFALKDVLARINTELHSDFQRNYEEVQHALELFGVRPADRIEILLVSGNISGRKKLLQSFCSRYGMHRISLPEILRLVADSPAEKESDMIQHCLKEGRTIPAQVTLKLVWRELSRHSYLGSFALEGFPITMDQVELCKDRLLKDVHIRGIVYFTGKDSEKQRQFRNQLMTFEAPFYYIDSEIVGEAAAKSLNSKFEQDGSMVPIIRKSRSPKVIMVVGAPGTGKGSQCERLRRDFGFDYVSTAQLLKAEISECRIYSQLIEQHISAGRLVPSSILVRLIKRHVFEKRVGGRRPLILDGFPRNLANMICWEDEVGDEIELVCLLNFECSQQVMEERLISAKNNRNLKESPPIIIKRFQQYLRETQPVLDAYLQQVVTVQAELSPEEVYAGLKESVMKRGYPLLPQREA